MPQFQVTVDIAATSQQQVEADLRAMSAAHTNKTLQVVWSEQRIS
jgi:hypothetical protein